MDCLSLLPRRAHRLAPSGSAIKVEMYCRILRGRHLAGRSTQSWEVNRVDVVEMENAPCR